jgi:macrodomain Ter protein organizer (MatP/YcbG family)
MTVRQPGSEQLSQTEVCAIEHVSGHPDHQGETGRVSILCQLDNRYRIVDHVVTHSISKCWDNYPFTLYFWLLWLSWMMAVVLFMRFKPQQGIRNQFFRMFVSTFLSFLRKAIAVSYIWWLSLPSLTRWRQRSSSFTSVITHKTRFLLS